MRLEKRFLKFRLLWGFCSRGLGRRTNELAHYCCYDGKHFAEVKNDLISLQMINVDDIKVNEKSVFMYTGTQHHVELVDDLNEYPFYENGKNKNTFCQVLSNV